MDPTTIATPANIAIAAVSFIALEIVAGGLKEIGKEIYGKVKGSLKHDELIKLDLLEKYPESKELKSEVAEALTKHLETSPELAKELEELLKRSTTTQIKENTININGEANITAQDVSGTVTINK